MDWVFVDLAVKDGWFSNVFHIVMLVYRRVRGKTLGDNFESHFPLWLLGWILLGWKARFMDRGWQLAGLWPDMAAIPTCSMYRHSSYVKCQGSIGESKINMGYPWEIHGKSMGNKPRGCPASCAMFQPTEDECPEVCTSEQQTCWVSNYDAQGRTGRPAQLQGAIGSDWDSHISYEKWGAIWSY